MARGTKGKTEADWRAERGLETEGTKPCKTCGRDLPYSMFAMHKGGYRKTFLPRLHCYDCIANAARKRRLNRAIAQRRFSAAERMLREHPEAMKALVRWNPSLYNQYLRQEKEKIIAEHEAKRRDFAQRPQSARPSDGRRMPAEMSLVTGEYDDEEEAG